MKYYSLSMTSSSGKFPRSSKQKPMTQLLFALIFQSVLGVFFVSIYRFLKKFLFVTGIRMIQYMFLCKW